MSVGLHILFFIISCLVLAKAGSWAVRSLMKIADFLNWKKFIVASLLMGLVSSMPEFFVGITASLAGKSELSFGNVIGSNIILFTLIIGVAVLMGGKIKLKGRTIQRSLMFAGLYALLPLLLIMDGEASRIDGVILIIALVFYFRELILSQRRFKKTFLDKDEESEVTIKNFRLFFRDLIIFLLSFGLIILTAQAIVFFGTRLAQQFNLSLVLIGALIVALGTSLPELSFGIRSVIMKEKEMVLGNVFGSIIINSALILGITCLISPFRIYSTALYLCAFIFTGITVLMFLIFSKTGDEITKREAKILLFIYVLFFLFQLLLK
ncbi:MAG: sodium:calcium antiporter [Patescibacteria group bacterium]|nr:sodium:calcium antiporter [Patescibacteria group bacterium]